MEKIATFETMTDKELDSIVKTIFRIQTNRRLERKKELIKNFHQAWEALKENGIEITYGEYETEVVQLSEWDCFGFN